MIGRTHQQGSYFMRGFNRDAPAPQNVGSQRALAFAAQQEVFDRALWTATAAATSAVAILDYVDLGASLVSIRGYDNLNDTVDYGRLVIPLVRQELAHRRTTGQVGRLQADHLGALAS